MNTSLTRSIGFWLLLVLSIASAAVGGWLISGQLGTMTTTLTDGTATGVEVYVGQSLIVVGSVFVGAGIIGVLLALALSAVQILILKRAAVVDPIDWTTQQNDHDAAVARAEEADSAVDADSTDASAQSEAVEDQNGSSGSTATATKINVK